MKQEFEIWKPVVGYEGLYEVSNLGRVKSLEREVYHSGCGKLLLHERILKQNTDGGGYKLVWLCVDGRRTGFKIHRLVAQAFIPNPNNLPMINHKDECRTNNSVDNLEWCDCKYNNNFGNRNKKLSKKLLNNPKLSKPITCVETEIIYKSINDVERQLGLLHGNLIRCLKGQIKTCGGFHWKYA